MIGCELKWSRVILPHPTMHNNVHIKTNTMSKRELKNAIRQLSIDIKNRIKEINSVDALSVVN